MTCGWSLRRQRGGGPYLRQYRRLPCRWTARVADARSRSDLGEANIKETDLADIRLGQPAQVRVDAYPGRTFEGRASLIGNSATSAFALLPNPNPSGHQIQDHAAHSGPLVGPARGLAAQARNDGRGID